MDFLQKTLKEEIEKKKKIIEEAKNVGSKNSQKKYVKRGDIEKLRQEKYLEEQSKLEEKRKRQLEEKKEKEGQLKRKFYKQEEIVQEEQEGEEIQEIDLSEEEVTKRLKSKNQPIRLEGENEQERKARLRALELMEERTEGQRNVLLKTMEEMEKEFADETKKNKVDIYQSIDTTPISMDLYRNDTDQLYFLMYVYFKRLLHEWGEEINVRSEAIKQSYEGRLLLATYMQSCSSLKPFFRSIRKRNFPDDVLARVTEICFFLQKREYVKAYDSYLRLSIGNAPWPIGVTMVGIHERSAREKIASNQVAHVLNDEMQRKWIQCIKRLMTFCQRKYPPDDFSKCVG